MWGLILGLAFVVLLTFSCLKVSSDADDAAEELERRRLYEEANCIAETEENDPLP